MWLSAAEFLVPGYGCMSTHGMCLLLPFLPSCLLKIYLELKQAGHGGRSDYLPRELVTGPCSALFSTSSLHFQSWRPEKSAKISTFCWAEPHFPQACLLWTRAHKYSSAGLNPRLGNELQLQEKKSNYMKRVPLDELLFSGTHLQPAAAAYLPTWEGSQGRRERQGVSVPRLCWGWAPSLKGLKLN